MSAETPLRQKYDYFFDEENQLCRLTVTVERSYDTRARQDVIYATAQISKPAGTLYKKHLEADPHNSDASNEFRELADHAYEKIMGHPHPEGYYIIVRD